MTDRVMFEQTLQKTHTWLNDMMEELGTDDRQKAYAGMRAALHALRDRLVIEEAADLGAQLPLLLRGVYYEGWKPAGKPVKDRSKREFLSRVTEELRDPTIEPEAAARALFSTLSKHISRGEIDDVKQILPEEIRQLWR